MDFCLPIVDYCPYFYYRNYDYENLNFFFVFKKNYNKKFIINLNNKSSKKEKFGFPWQKQNY